MDKKLNLSREDINFLQDQFVERYVNHLYRGMESKEVHTRIWFDSVVHLLSAKGLIKSSNESDESDSSVD